MIKNEDKKVFTLYSLSEKSVNIRSKKIERQLARKINHVIVNCYDTFLQAE